jgi:hypothetical protein
MEISEVRLEEKAKRPQRDAAARKIESPVYRGRTFSACQPLGPLVTSNSTL